MFIPVCAKHLKTSYLGCASHMLADTRTDIIITDTNQSDGIGYIFWQTTGIDALWQIIERNKLECDRQILLNEFVHPHFDHLLFLTARLMIQMKTHLTFLPLYMGIKRSLTAKDTYHRLVQKMLRRMCRWKLFLIVLIKEVVGHIVSNLIAKILISNHTYK